MISKIGLPSEPYIYWQQNLPGADNKIQYRNETVTNWWQFFEDWDNAIKNKVGLHALVQSIEKK